LLKEVAGSNPASREEKAVIRTTTLLTLIVIPAIFGLVKGFRLKA
jgi:hypothetical protein